MVTERKRILMKAGVQAAVGAAGGASPCFKSLGTLGRQHSDGNEVSHPPKNSF